MFVDKVVFLLGDLIPPRYILLSPLVNKTKDVIWKSIKKFIIIPRSRNIYVRIVRTDPERAAAALDTDIAELGCQLNSGGNVERTIRKIKEVQRLNILPSSTKITVYSLCESRCKC
jgi:hypothetical protein